MCEGDLGDAQHGGKNFRRDLHGARLGRGTRGRLRKSRGRGGVEGHVALNLFQRLVDMAIEHGDRTKVFQKTERAFGVRLWCP